MTTRFRCYLCSTRHMTLPSPLPLPLPPLSLFHGNSHIETHEPFLVVSDSFLLIFFFFPPPFRILRQFLSTRIWSKNLNPACGSVRFLRDLLHDDVFWDILVLVLPLQPLRPRFPPGCRGLSRLRRRIHRRNRTPAALSPPRSSPPPLPSRRHVHDRSAPCLRQRCPSCPAPHPPQRWWPLPFQPRYRPPRQRSCHLRYKRGGKSRLWAVLRRWCRFWAETLASEHVRVSTRIWIR